jgi:hypothetical protein
VYLPDDLVRSNLEDPDWLNALPALLDSLAGRWGIVLESQFPDARINYVAPATREDGARCVLKVSRHVGESRYEIAALRLWDGRGADVNVRSQLLQMLLADTCELCGTEDHIQVHHMRHLKDLKRK